MRRQKSGAVARNKEVEAGQHAIQRINERNEMEQIVHASVIPPYSVVLEARPSFMCRETNLTPYSGNALLQEGARNRAEPPRVSTKQSLDRATNKVPAPSISIRGRRPRMYRVDSELLH